MRTTIAGHVTNSVSGKAIALIGIPLLDSNRNVAATARKSTHERKDSLKAEPRQCRRGPRNDAQKASCPGSIRFGGVIRIGLAFVSNPFLDECSHFPGYRRERATPERSGTPVLAGSL